MIGVITGSFTEMAITFALIIIHELGHIGMALFFRWKINKVMFWPFGGVMETDDYFTRPNKEEFIVVLAGPLQHVWMHFLLLYFLEAGTFSPYFIEYALTYNVTLFLFNLLPIYPLDGGKLVLLLLSYSFPFRKVIPYTVILSVASITIGFSVLYYFHWLTFHTLLLACFLLLENRLEWKQQQYIFLRHLMTRYEKQTKNRLQQTLKATPSTRVYDIMKSFRKDYYHIIQVDGQEGKFVHLSEEQCLQAYFEWKRPYERIENVIHAGKT